MGAFFRLTVVLALTLAAYSQEDQIWINMIEKPDQWFHIGSDAVVVCQWEVLNSAGGLEYMGNATETLSWKAKGSGIRKIYKDDEEGSYIFQNTPIAPERQNADTVWDTQPRDARLTILDFQISDPTSYICEVDVGMTQSSKGYNIFPFAIPTVSVRDVNTAADLRPPPTPEEDNSETNSTETESTYETEEGNMEDEYETQPDYNYAADEAAGEEAEKISVVCMIEGAYPKPTKVEFVISESERLEATTVNIEQGADRLYSGNASLELTPTTDLDGVQIGCEVVLLTGANERVEKSSNVSSKIQVFHQTTYVKTEIVPEVVNQGNQVEIRCNADGNPQPVLGIEPSDGFTAISHDKFVNPSVTKHQAGEYRCYATVQDLSDPTQTHRIDGDILSLTVNYIEEPTLSETKTEVTLRKGEEITISCDADATPPADIEWKKQGELVSKGTLVITNAQYHDQGEYICEASNSVGKKSKSINIRVDGACDAEFKAPVVHGSKIDPDAFQVKLECVVTGQPTCQVDITSRDDIIGLHDGKKSNGNRVLEFAALPKLHGPTSFYCIATNQAGKPANATYTFVDGESDLCCEKPKKGGLSTGAIIGIILLVLVVVVGIPVACYFVKKRNAQPKKKAPADAEAVEPEKEGLKEASSEV